MINQRADFCFMFAAYGYDEPEIPSISLTGLTANNIEFGRSSRMLFAFVHDQKVVQFFPTSELSKKPPRLLSAPSPRLILILGISVFGNDLWIWALCPDRQAIAGYGSQLTQPRLQQCSLCSHLLTELGYNGFMQLP